ncbi:MAG: DUF4386 domain-containing protein [Methanomassiliicoccales archaeon]
MNVLAFLKGINHLSKNGDGQSTPMVRQARIAGLFYLIFIVLLPVATTIRDQLIVSGDASATAQKILANELLFRISYITELVSALFFVLAAWALYSLLKSVNKNLALLFLLLNLCGVATECVSVLNLATVPSLLSGVGYMVVFSTDQLQAQAMLHIDMYHNGFIIAQLFFGAWLVPLGYLVYRSSFLPRLLGLLLIIDFFGVLSRFLQFFLLPEYEFISYPGYAAGFIAEVSLTLWLLFKGAKENGPSPAEGV